jgi:hypothetical protein
MSSSIGIIPIIWLIDDIVNKQPIPSWPDKLI